jgi:hypothetical protein
MISRSASDQPVDDPAHEENQQHWPQHHGELSEHQEQNQRAEESEESEEQEEEHATPAFLSL